MIERRIFLQVSKLSLIHIFGNKDLGKRQKGTELTEKFSTEIFGFNKTADGLHFLSGSTIKEIAAANGMECREIDESTYTSNIIFVLKQV